jgi:phage repressor protein C with HTH and peptisase S24 domain
MSSDTNVALNQAAPHFSDMGKSVKSTKKTGLGARIAKAREAMNMNQTAFGLAFGITRSAVSQWESETTEPTPENLRAIATRSGADYDWLATGRGIPSLDGDDRPVRDYDDTPHRPQDGILEIDVRAGLGGGGSMDHREVRHDGDYADPVKPEAWKFPSRFMRDELRAPESQVIILETDGDSMEPTIGSGERIIVHTGMKTPSPDGIFALRDTFGNIIAKRLQVLRKGDPPRVLIISDNKAHATEEVGLDEIHIVGRVLWGLKRL